MGNTKAMDEQQPSFQQWCFHETVETLHKEQTLTEERRQLEQEKHRFQREQEEFRRTREFEERKRMQQQTLFDMKLKILEDELVKLADEKQHLQMQKAFYDRVSHFEESFQERTGSYQVVKGELFFTGVGNKQSLRKRYKDLIKIYHPDNLDGDTVTLQEINREFNELNKMM